MEMTDPGQATGRARRAAVTGSREQKAAMTPAMYRIGKNNALLLVFQCTTWYTYYETKQTTFCNYSHKGPISHEKTNSKLPQ